MGRLLDSWFVLLQTLYTLVLPSMQVQLLSDVASVEVVESVTVLKTIFALYLLQGPSRILGTTHMHCLACVNVDPCQFADRRRCKIMMPS